MWWRTPRTRAILPLVAVTAHLDTVFAPRSSDDIRFPATEDFLGPGTSDNGAGLTALLALAAAWMARPPFQDLEVAPVLVANVARKARESQRHAPFLPGMDTSKMRDSGAGRAGSRAHHFARAGQPPF